MDYNKSVDKCLEAKFVNYCNLRKVLTTVIDEIFSCTRAKDFSVAGIKHFSKLDIEKWYMEEWGSKWFELPIMFRRYMDSYPREVKSNGENHFVLLMISPESTKNPVYNSLEINKVGDIFRAMRIVSNAFYALIETKEKQICQN